MVRSMSEVIEMPKAKLQPAPAEKHKFSNPKRVRAQVQDAVDELKQSIAASGPNMNPAGIGGVPDTKREPEQAPELSELIEDVSDRAVLGALLMHHAMLTGKLKPLEDERSRIADRIKSMVKDYGIERAQHSGVSVAYYPTTRKTLNQVKLLEAGVSSNVIVSCTDVSTSYTLKVTPVKES